MIETECLRIFEALLWVAEEMKVDHDQLECFVFDKIEKIEIEIFNWSENTMISCLMFWETTFAKARQIYSAMIRSEMTFEALI